MTFHVGQRVVCVKRGVWKSSPGGYLPINPWPVFGEVYTVDGIASFDGEPFLILAECQNGYFGLPPKWAAAEFRPVIERKTDISIFTAMLTPSDPRKVSA